MSGAAAEWRGRGGTPGSRLGHASARLSYRARWYQSRRLDLAAQLNKRNLFREKQQGDGSRAAEDARYEVAGEADAEL